MKFNIPKIVRRLEMSAYAEEMDGLALHVWVNPPRSVKSEYWNLQVEIIGLKHEVDKLLTGKKPDLKKVDAMNEKVGGVNLSIYEWYANILSQASDPDTHVAAEELVAMADEDPALWIFMAQRAQTLIEEHSENARKN